MNKVVSQIIGLEKAIHRYEKLHKDENARSLESGKGRFAILVSGTAHEGSDFSPGRQREMLNDHAEHLAALYEGQHQEILIVRGAGAAAINEQLRDPETTDMATMGHGDITALAIEDGIAYSSGRVTRNAIHLKTGMWLHAVCGIFPARFSVPMPTFAVDKFSNVRAAPGRTISLADPDFAAFQPLYVDDIGIRKQIGALNRAHYTPAPSFLDR
jgi:hypothetical protein